MATPFERVIKLTELRERILLHLNGLRTVARAEVASTLLRDSLHRVFWAEKQQIEIIWRGVDILDNQPTYIFTVNSTDEYVNEELTLQVVNWFAMRSRAGLKSLKLLAASADNYRNFSKSNIDTNEWFQTISNGVFNATNQICKAAASRVEWCSAVESLQLGGQFYCSTSGVKLLQACRDSIKDLSIDGMVWFSPKCESPVYNYKHNVNDYLLAVRQCQAIERVSLSSTNVSSTSETADVLLRRTFESLPNLRQLSLGHLSENHQNTRNLATVSLLRINLAQVETIELSPRYSGAMNICAFLAVSSCPKLRLGRLRVSDDQDPQPKHTDSLHWRILLECVKRWLHDNQSCNPERSLTIEFVGNGGRQRMKDAIRRFASEHAEFNTDVSTDSFKLSRSGASITLVFPPDEFTG